jgi:E-phenylitaconyl-CoA hydratase
MAIHYTLEQQVAIITLDRPEALNALDLVSLKELRAALVQARDDEAVRAIVLTGAGERAFCVGADLKNTLPPTRSYGAAYVKSLHQAADQGIYVRLLDLSDLKIWKPIIAAINGHCLGGGLELALQCDLRVAAANASFGLTEATVASIPAVNGIQSLLKAVPTAIAMKLLLTGDKVSAAFALQAGLVSDVVSAGEALEAALALAHRIAANGPLAVQMIKRIAAASANLPHTQAVEFTELAWGAIRDSADRVEGRKAFSEKRRPVYRGR